MKCSMLEMRAKEVINTLDGTRLGFVSDVEMDTNQARLTAIIVYGRLKLFGLLGREDDIKIPWDRIGLIGDDTVLVNYDYRELKKVKKTAGIGNKVSGFFDKINF